MLADAGEQQHAGGGDREPGGERDADAGAGDHVLGGVHADGDRAGERQEGQAGLQRAGAEHVLQVQRGQQEGPEQHGRGRQHHHEAAADGAIGEPLDAQERLRVRSSSAANTARPAIAAAPMPSVCIEVQPALSACERA